MSAINPASFVTPTASLGIPPAYGNAAYNMGRDSPGTRRRHFGPGIQQQSPAIYDETIDPERSAANLQTTSLRSPYFNPYQSFGAGMPQAGLGVPSYMSSMQGPLDPFSPYFAPAYMLNPAAPSFASSHNTDSRNRPSNQASNADWATKFQGLSLGS